MKEGSSNSRREFLRKLGSGTMFLGLGGLGIMSPAESYAASPYRLTILHTNDMHSRIEPFPQDGRAYAGLGGMARRATIVNQIRREEKNVLLLDAGDIWQGTPYFNLFNGEPEFKLMTEMKYDAATLGNHDFDNGLEGLKEQLPNAGFSFVNSNYNFSNTILERNVNPFRLFGRGGIKVGVFGLGIELAGIVAEKNYGKVRYNDPVAVAKEMVQELRKQGCHLIICLSHLGYEYESNKVSDVVLARQVDGIDLIIGGHTHTFLDRPVVITGPEGKDVLVNQVGFGGINLGRINFLFNKRKEKNGVFSSCLRVSEKSSEI